MRAGHAEQRARLCLLGDVVKPVAVSEAQEALEARPDRALEAAHARRLGARKLLSSA